MELTKPRRQRGFTLIEALLAVAMAAILASIALPSYREQVAKSRRLSAQARLYSAAQFMERYHTENHRYDQNTAGQAVTLPAPLQQTEDGAYTLRVLTPDRDSYTLFATPSAAQLNDRCGVFRLSHTGLQGASQPDCWRR
jgi:type IV pilus assembly protein PilE